jgi:hypothetical protein
MNIATSIIARATTDTWPSPTGESFTGGRGEGVVTGIPPAEGVVAAETEM